MITTNCIIQNVNSNLIKEIRNKSEIKILTEQLTWFVVENMVPCQSNKMKNCLLLT